MRIRRKPLGDVPTYKSKLYGSQPLGTRSDLNEDPLYSMVALVASSFKASIVYPQNYPSQSYPTESWEGTWV